jgi:hypothetical protein
MLAAFANDFTQVSQHQAESQSVDRWINDDLASAR